MGQNVGKPTADLGGPASDISVMHGVATPGDDAHDNIGRAQPHEQKSHQFGRHSERTYQNQCAPEAAGDKNMEHECSSTPIVPIIPRSPSNHECRTNESDTDQDD